MDISIYFTPLAAREKKFSKDQMGGLIDIYTEEESFPKWEDAKLIFIGIKEERGTVNNTGCGLGSNQIRKELNLLFFKNPPKWWI